MGQATTDIGKLEVDTSYGNAEDDSKGRAQVMEEAKTLAGDPAAEGYDAADRPFDFVGEGSETALICAGRPGHAGKDRQRSQGRGVSGHRSGHGKDALKAMRFHIFDVVVLDELFDTADRKANAVLQYLDGMAMTTRRRFFVALLSKSSARWTTWLPSTGA